MSDERKHTMAVITFSGHDTADQAYDDLHHADDVKIKTAAVVTRKDNGKLKLKHKRRITVWKGIIGGGAIGALLAVATGGVGLAAGALAGGLVGTTRHKQRQHLKEYLDDKLGQNDSALGIEFKDDTNWTAVESIVDKYNGDYLKVELTPEAKAVLDQMATDEDTAKAVSAEVESEDADDVEEVEPADDSGDGEEASE